MGRVLHVGGLKKEVLLLHNTRFMIMRVGCWISDDVGRPTWDPMKLACLVLQSPHHQERRVISLLALTWWDYQAPSSSWTPAGPWPKSSTTSSLWFVRLIKKKGFQKILWKSRPIKISGYWIVQCFPRRSEKKDVSAIYGSNVAFKLLLDRGRY